MIINNFNLANDNDFKLFANSIVDDFISYKIRKCSNLPIVDSLLKYSAEKELDEDILGDCIKTSITLTKLLEKELESSAKSQNLEYEIENW